MSETYKKAQEEFDLCDALNLAVEKVPSTGYLNSNEEYVINKLLVALRTKHAWSSYTETVEQETLARLRIRISVLEQALIDIIRDDDAAWGYYKLKGIAGMALANKDDQAAVLHLRTRTEF